MSGVKNAGLQQEWVAEGRIVILTIRDTTMETLETWAQTTRNIILTWPIDRPILIMHDYSHVDLLVSPYMRRVSEELSRTRPEIQGRVAAILKKTIMAQLAQVVLNTIWNKGYQARERRVFFNRDDGLKWLLEP